MKIGDVVTRKYIIVAGLFIAWIVAYVDRIAMSISIVPIAKEFALDASSTGYVLSAFYVTYAIMQLGGGWLSDRFGSRRILVFCIASWSVFTGLTGLAWSATSLIVVRLLFGLGEGGFSPASSVTIAETFPKQQRARAKTFVLSSLSFGNALGSGLVAAAVYAYGWRNAYHVLGIIGLVVAIGLWFAVAEARVPHSGDTGTKSLSLRLLGRPMVLKIMLIWFFSSIVFHGLQSWMPSYLVKAYDIDILHIGFISAIPPLVAFFALNYTGWLLDKIGQGQERVFMAVGAVFVTLFFGLMITTHSLTWLIVYWTLANIAFNIIYATLFSIPLKYVSEEVIGSATGAMNFGGQIAGAVAPTVMGLLISHFHQSFMPAFLFLLGSGVFSLLTALTWRPDAAAEADALHLRQAPA
jgi:MFS transporter, ACS family, hexuronate transporter